MEALLTRENLRDPRYAVLTDFSSPSETLIVSFAGLGAGNNCPPFEFGGALRNFDVKKALVRDPENYAYHGGLRGLSKDIDQTAAYLRDLFKRSGATRIVTLGNCQGGYAAMLFGALAGADECVVFAPLTFLDSANRLLYGETRWPEGFERIYTAPSPSPEYYDLCELDALRELPITLYYDTTHPIDSQHSERLLERFPHIQAERIEGGGHLFVLALKRRGHLNRILMGLCFGM
ncbi:MAG TPA: hypothetical protein ENJ88_10895 [Phaeodactylibacter sp.]|nr:hypothetical protein [Phaeodactylibacter sp.]